LRPNSRAVVVWVGSYGSGRIVVVSGGFSSDGHIGIVAAEECSAARTGIVSNHSPGRFPHWHRKAGFSTLSGFLQDWRRNASTPAVVLSSGDESHGVVEG
jgi:hypothetical protein